MKHNKKNHLCLLQTLARMTQINTQIEKMFLKIDKICIVVFLPIIPNK